MSAALPKQVYPPLFNRYAGGMSFGNHVDNAIRVHAASRTRLRTDLSATLFLTPPEDYDGGELLVEDTYGVHLVETAGRRPRALPCDQPAPRDAGDARRAQLVVLLDPEHGRRRWPASLLFDLDMAIVRLARDTPGHPSLVSLTGCYHNLLRMWAEL